jgi:hypothetical protein
MFDIFASQKESVSYDINVLSLCNCTLTEFIRNHYMMQSLKCALILCVHVKGSFIAMIFLLAAYRNEVFHGQKGIWASF